ncbi:hypothetical protein AK812_SmicGene25798 [Symbiodinium microadriaticum]|uniref:Uncharacterized protein n=1 Tax=Symbiodinium microadriaticum TaxID=2951 RepID=A0A1Q9DB96_SYMMI|nr:hypothetical protein AK812_SmicGene25798 [Symbiodinium microadriaticum]
MAGEGALVPVDRPAADELRLALAEKSFEKYLVLDGGDSCLQGPGAIPWKFADVDELSTAIINSFPDKALRIVMSENFVGTSDLVRLEHAIARPSYRELKANFVLLRPVIQKHPDKAQFDLDLNVPSGLFLTDVFLLMHEKLSFRLLQGDAKAAAGRVQDPDDTAGESDGSAVEDGRSADAARAGHADDESGRSRCGDADCREDGDDSDDDYECGSQVSSNRVGPLIPGKEGMTTDAEISEMEEEAPETCLPRPPCNDPAVCEESDSEDDSASMATTLKLGEHLVSEHEVVESPCDWCDIMPEKEGCCVGCGCSLVPMDEAAEPKQSFKKKAESESDDDLPPFVVEAAKAMDDSQASGATVSTAKPKQRKLAGEQAKPEKKKKSEQHEKGEPKPKKKREQHENGETKPKKKCEQHENGGPKPKKKCEQLENGDSLQNALEHVERDEKPGHKRKGLDEAPKASFKRPKTRGKGRDSDASTAAPSSAAGGVLSVEHSEAEQEERLAIVPAPALPAETGDDMWHSYDLKALNMPSECRPLGPGRGLHSYTVSLDGATFDVLMKKKGFFVKKPVGEGKKGTISWGCNGGIEAAWLKAKKHAGLK